MFHAPLPQRCLPWAHEALWLETSRRPKNNRRKTSEYTLILILTHSSGIHFGAELRHKKLLGFKKNPANLQYRAEHSWNIDSFSTVFITFTIVFMCRHKLIKTKKKKEKHWAALKARIRVLSCSVEETLIAKVGFEQPQQFWSFRENRAHSAKHKTEKSFERI